MYRLLSLPKGSWSCSVFRSEGVFQPFFVKWKRLPVVIFAICLTDRKKNFPGNLQKSPLCLVQSWVLGSASLGSVSNFRKKVLWKLDSLRGTPILGRPKESLGGKDLIHEGTFPPLDMVSPSQLGSGGSWFGNAPKTLRNPSEGQSLFICIVKHFHHP